MSYQGVRRSPKKGGNKLHKIGHARLGQPHKMRRVVCSFLKKVFMVTKYLSRFVALSFMCLLPFASAAAQGAEPLICAEKSETEFLYDFSVFGLSNDVELMRNVQGKIDDASKTKHNECASFCAEQKCDSHDSHHHHPDGTKKIQTGTIEKLIEASPMDFLSIQGSIGNAAWESIQWHCVCKNSVPSVDPVVQ